MRLYLNFILLSLLLSMSACNKTPDDVTLNSITQDVDGIHISWEQSDDKKFHSYKLYEHTSSGVDESTGNLVYISTSAEDNSYTDTDFEPLQTYYYRVYVVNKKEISNGSNIESITSETISLVSNGSFEEGNNIPTSWTLIENNLNEPLNSITLDQTAASDSSKSLKFHHNASSGCWEMWIEQTISLSDLSENGTYEFSFDYKSNELLTPSGMGIVLDNNSIDVQINSPTFVGDGAWHTFASQFTLPSNLGSSDPQLTIHFCIEGQVDWWLDNISIIKFS